MARERDRSESRRSPSESPRRVRRSRSRSTSYSPRSRSPSPRRRTSRGRRYDDDRGRQERYPSFRDRRPYLPTGLLVRNISLDARPEDLRIPFERFGPVKDVYLPKNYYTGEPRGFGFVKYRNPDDAAEAKSCMNHKIIGGREISIVYAEENRKHPDQMRSNARVRSSRHGGAGPRRYSPPRSPRPRHAHHSRSVTPPRHYSRGRGDYNDDYSEGRSVSMSPIRRSRSRTPPASHGRSSVSPKRGYSPRENGSRPVRSSHLGERYGTES